MVKHQSICHLHPSLPITVCKIPTNLPKTFLHLQKGARPTLYLGIAGDPKAPQPPGKSSRTDAQILRVGFRIYALGFSLSGNAYGVSWFCRRLERVEPKSFRQTEFLHGCAASVTSSQRSQARDQTRARHARIESFQARLV